MKTYRIQLIVTNEESREIMFDMDATAIQDGDPVMGAAEALYTTFTTELSQSGKLAPLPWAGA